MINNKVFEPCGYFTDKKQTILFRKIIAAQRSCRRSKNTPTLLLKIKKVIEDDQTFHNTLQMDLCTIYDKATPITQSFDAMDIQFEHQVSIK